MIKNVTVVGAGRMGSHHIRRLKEEHPELHVGVKDLGMAMEFYEPQAVIIATPSETHYAIAEEYLSQGVHVLCEKPLTLDIGEAMRLTIIAAQNNATLLVGHTQRYNSVFVDNLENLQSSEFLNFDFHLPHNRKVEDIVFDLMIHQLELAFYLFGRVPDPEEIEITFAETQELKVQAHLKIGKLECTFRVSYGNDNDTRTIENQRGIVDLLDCGEAKNDSLYYLHNRFLELCDAGETPSDTAFALCAIAVAQGIEEMLFP